jgi:hypothetical protein
VTAVAIHQPEYFPWLGLLDKARRADVFVILDDVQFDRSSLQHRAKIAGPNGVSWLTIPYVHKFPQRIDEMQFADPRWATKHWKSLQAAYGRAPGWKAAAPRLEAFFTAAHPKVVDATVGSVLLLLEAFEVRPARIVRSSELGVTGEKAELVYAICQALSATTYLSGRSGATYLDEAHMRGLGIGLDVQRFTVPDHPRPRALSEEDARGLSALDAWLLTGPDAPALLRGDLPS